MSKKESGLRKTTFLYVRFSKQFTLMNGLKWNQHKIYGYF